MRWAKLAKWESVPVVSGKRTHRTKPISTPSGRRARGAHVASAVRIASTVAAEGLAWASRSSYMTMLRRMSSACCGRREVQAALAERRDGRKRTKEGNVCEYSSREYPPCLCAHLVHCSDQKCQVVLLHVLAMARREGA